MIMSKKGSRVVSLIIAFALVLTGLMLTPKSSSAAAEPEVSVLGASIRLGDGYNSNGMQSMRMAINVKNASVAKNCSIDIEVGGKIVTIATDGEESATRRIYNKAYSVDTENDSIVYAVTINNIPQSSFSTGIGIKGNAEALESAVVKSTEQVMKSIDGIVQALSEEYSGLNITLVNGILYKNNGTELLTPEDIKDYIPELNPDDTENDEDKYALDLSGIKIQYNQGTITANADGSVTLKGQNDGKLEQGFIIPFNTAVEAGKKVTIKVYGTIDGDADGLRMWLSSDGMNNMSTTVEPVEFAAAYEMANNQSSDSTAVMMKKRNGKTVNSFTITKVLAIPEGADVPEVTPTEEPAPTEEPVPTEGPIATEEPAPTEEPTATTAPDTDDEYALDLSGIKVQYNQGEVMINADGSATITGQNGGSLQQGFIIPFNTPVEAGKKVNITIYGSVDGDADGARMWLSSDSMNNMSTTVEPVEFATSYEMTNNQSSDSTAVMMKKRNGKTVNSITITKVIAIPEGADVPEVPPTEEPAPTEEPMPTEEPAATPEPTIEPTAEPTVAPTEVPTEAPTEAPTVAPTEAPDPGNGQIVDITKNPSANGATVTVNENGSVSGSNIELMLFPIEGSFKTGDEVYVTVYGEVSNDTPRVWISQGAWDRVTNLVNPYTFGEEIKLVFEKDCSSASVQIKKAGSNFNNITINRIVIRQENAGATPDPTEAPTATPVPTAVPTPIPPRETTTIAFDPANIVISGGVEGETATLGEDGSISYEKADGFSGMIIPLPSEYAIGTGQSFYAIVDYESTGCNARAYLIRGTNDGATSNILAAAPSPLEGTMTATGDGANHIFIKASAWDTKFTSLKINSITLSDNAPDITKGSVDLSTFNARGIAENGFVVNEDGSIQVTFVSSYAGSAIAIPEKLQGLKSVELKVVSSKNGEELSGGNQIVFKDTDGNDIDVRYARDVISVTIPDDKKLGSIMFNAQEASADAPQVMTISYINLQKIYTLDLANFVPRGNESSTLNEDGTLTLVYHNNYTGSNIDLSEYADCTYVEAKITSAKGETVQTGTQVCLRDSEGNEIQTSYIGDWNPGGVISFNVPEGKTVGSLTINTQSASADEPVTQTIYYIKAR